MNRFPIRGFRTLGIAVTGAMTLIWGPVVVAGEHELLTPTEPVQSAEAEVTPTNQMEELTCRDIADIYVAAEALVSRGAAIVPAVAAHLATEPNLSARLKLCNLLARLRGAAVAGLPALQALVDADQGAGREGAAAAQWFSSGRLAHLGSIPARSRPIYYSIANDVGTLDLDSCRPFSAHYFNNPSVVQNIIARSEGLL